MIKKIVLFSFLSFLLLFGLYHLNCGSETNVQLINPSKKVKKANLPDFNLDNLEDSAFSYQLNCSFDSISNLSRVYFGENYGEDSSILCFRGNAQRSKPSIGKIKTKPTRLQIKWKFKTDVDNTKTQFGVWGGGTGWTGQPLYVKWKKGNNWKQNLNSGYTDLNELEEVIFGSLCGKVYFIDFNTGIETRNPLTIGNPIKGTISLDPRLNGMLYVGQGIKHTDKFGSYFFNMFSGELLNFQTGLDNFSYRLWGAFDSNPLIDEQNSTLFWPAENGIIYRYDLKNLTKEPIKFKYSVQNKPHQGIESSFGAFRNLGYFSDNNGNVFCLNLNTMKPVWYFDNLDDSDASVVIDIENDNPFIYLGNEVDKQGAKGSSFFRKLDGLTGKEIWSIQRNCSGENKGALSNNGGILSTCIVGKQKAIDIAITIFSRVGEKLGGEIVAVNKKTGREIYSIELDNYSWSSPVDLYDSQGNMYFILGDVSGEIALYEGKTGKKIDFIQLEGAIESSPIAVNNTAIIGTRGGFIYAISVE
jgi:outer membrane protein assembly factor BamB